MIADRRFSAQSEKTLHAVRHRVFLILQAAPKIFLLPYLILYMIVRVQASALTMILPENHF